MPGQIRGKFQPTTSMTTGTDTSMMCMGLILSPTLEILRMITATERTSLAPSALEATTAPASLA